MGYATGRRQGSGFAYDLMKQDFSAEATGNDVGKRFMLSLALTHQDCPSAAENMRVLDRAGQLRNQRLGDPTTITASHAIRGCRT
jgi:hypothetical protein